VSRAKQHSFKLLTDFTMGGKMKIFIILVLLLFGIFIFVGGAIAVNKSSHTHKASVVVPLDGAQPPPEKYIEPTPLMYESLQPNCEDIHPDSGVVVIQHDQWGSTYYDNQQNGSMGRMIAVSPAGHKHMICHETRGPYGTSYPRYVTYNCKDPLGNWLNPNFGINIDGGTNINAGYPNIGVLHDGRAGVIYHRSFPPAPAYHWATTMALGDTSGICTGSFTDKYDVPDWLGSAENGMWPQMGIVYGSSDTDYIHIVMTESTPWGDNFRLGYVRCHLIHGDTLLCATPTGQSGTVSPIKVVPNAPGCGTSCPIAYFGECEAPGVPPDEYPNTISLVVVTSPVSQKVAIVFTNKRESGPSPFNNDVFYFESTNNGQEWFPQYGGTWPPTQANGMLHNITNYATDFLERAYIDVAACYDYNDHLHIVWNSCYYDSTGESWNFNANLMHWTDTDSLGIDHASLVAPGYWDDGSVDPGAFCRTVCKMSISALDPIYHPGGSPDSVYLFCIWTQFDYGDVSLGGYSNGDIYGSVSGDGGATWVPPYNLTNTKTPDCTAGNCLSEHWSSLAQNMYDGDLHIEYVCDREAGECLRASGWTDNPMMYLHIAQLPIDHHCGISNPSLDPPSFDTPPIKIPPNGSKTITLQLKSLYNAGGYYQVTSSNPCKVSIDINPTGFLNPNDSVIVEGTIHCTGEELISANITVIGCKSTIDADTFKFPLYAVCSNDYYECRSDPKTILGIDNGVCSLWTTSNTLQILWDKRIVADDMEGKKIISAASPFAATIFGTDTVVGIEESDKSYTGARDTINMWVHLINAAPNCYIKRGIVEKTYLWFPRPYPQNPVWYWLDLRQQIITFVDRPPHTCEDFYKEQVIKQVWVKFSRPPNWWPSPGVYSGHNDIYFGYWADIDAPSDTGCIACNTAGWDDTRKMIWHHGRGIAGGHPEYSDHYVALALTDPTGVVIDPIGVQDVKNNVYIYPHSGWVIDSLYQLTATPGVNIHDPDSVADRTVVLTAGKIDAGGATDTLYVGKFIIIEATIKGGSGTGLSDLQTYIDNTRSTIIPLLNSTGVLPKCGDVNCDGNINSADVGYLLNYLFVGGPPPCKPFRVNPSRADVSGDGKVNTADIVYLINYLFVSGSPAPNCPGM
jgi:hypothetical protein